MQQTPTLIEQTDKRYKLLIIAGNLLFALGILLCFSSFSETVSNAGIAIETMLKVGGTTVVTGILVHALGKFFAWWEHG